MEEQPDLRSIRFLLAEPQALDAAATVHAPYLEIENTDDMIRSMPVITRMRHVSSSAPVHPREIPFMELDITRAAMDDMIAGRFSSTKDTAKEIIDDYHHVLAVHDQSRATDNPFHPSQTAAKYRILASSEQHQADVLYDPHTRAAQAALESLPESVVYTQQSEPALPLAYAYVHATVEAAAGAATAAAAAGTNDYQLDVLSQLRAYDELWRNVVWPQTGAPASAKDRVAGYVSTYIMNVCDRLREGVIKFATSDDETVSGFTNIRPDNYAGAPAIMNAAFTQFYKQTNTCLQYVFGDDQWTADKEMISKLWTVDHRESAARDSFILGLYLKNFTPILRENAPMHEVDVREPDAHVFTINGSPLVLVKDRHVFDSTKDVFVTAAPRMCTKMFYFATAFLCLLTTMIISAHLQKKLTLPVRVQQQIDALLARHAIPSMSSAVDIVSEYLFGFSGDAMREALRTKDYPEPRYAEVLQTLVRTIMSEAQTASTRNFALEISRLNCVFLGYASDLALGNTLIRNAMKSRAFMHMARMAGEGKDVLGVERCITVLANPETKTLDARQRLADAIHRHLNLYNHTKLLDIIKKKLSIKPIALPPTADEHADKWHALVAGIAKEVFQQSAMTRDPTVMSVAVKEASAEAALELATYLLLLTIMIAQRMSEKPAPGSDSGSEGEKKRPEPEVGGGGGSGGGGKGAKKMRMNTTNGRFYYENASNAVLQLRFEPVQRQDYTPENMRARIESGVLPAHVPGTNWEALHATALSLYDTLVPVSQAIMSIAASDASPGAVAGPVEMYMPTLDTDALRTMIEKTGGEGKTAAARAMQQLCAHMAAGGRVSAGLCATHPMMQFSVHVSAGASGGSGTDGKSSLLVRFLKENWRRYAPDTDKFDPLDSAYIKASTEETLRTYHPDLVNFMLGFRTPDNVQSAIMQVYTHEHVDVLADGNTSAEHERQRAHARLLRLAQEFHDTLIVREGDKGYTDRCVEETVAFFRQYLECHDKALSCRELRELHHRLSEAEGDFADENEDSVGFGVPNEIMNMRRAIEDILPGVENPVYEFMVLSQSRVRGSPVLIARRAAELLYSDSHETRAAVDVFVDGSGNATVSAPGEIAGSRMRAAVSKRGERTLYSLGVFQWPILRMHELFEDLRKHGRPVVHEPMSVGYSERVYIPPALLFSPHLASKVTAPDATKSRLGAFFTNAHDRGYTIGVHINQRVNESMRLGLVNNALIYGMNDDTPLTKHMQLVAMIIATNPSHFLATEEGGAMAFIPLSTIIARERAVLAETLSRGRPVEAQETMLENTMMLRSRTRMQSSRFVNSVDDDMEERAQALMNGIESLFYLFRETFVAENEIDFQNMSTTEIIDKYTVTKSGTLSQKTLDLLDFVADNAMFMYGESISQDMSAIIDKISKEWNAIMTDAVKGTKYINHYVDYNTVINELGSRRVNTRASSEGSKYTNFYLPQSKLAFMNAAMDHYMGTRGNVDLLEIQNPDSRKPIFNYKKFLYYVVVIYEWLMEPLTLDNRPSKHHAFGLLKIVEALTVSPFIYIEGGLYNPLKGFSQAAHFAYYAAFPGYMNNPAVVVDRNVLTHLSSVMSESRGVRKIADNVLAIEKSAYPLLFLDSDSSTNVRAQEQLRRDGFVRATAVFSPEFMSAWPVRESLRQLVGAPSSVGEGAGADATEMIGKIMQLEAQKAEEFWVYWPIVNGFDEQDFLALFQASMPALSNEQRMRIELMASLCNGEGIITHTRVTAPLETEKAIVSWSASAAAHILAERLRRMGFERQVIGTDETVFDVEPTLMITITASLMHRETNHVDVNYIFNAPLGDLSDAAFMNVFIQTESDRYALILGQRPDVDMT